jgi:uncharacterized protein YcbX
MVESIWRYPLKSAQGERLRAVYIGLDGPEGDRAWACITQDGIVVSAKHPRRWGRLLFVLARLVTSGPGGLTVTIPGQLPLTAGSPATDAALSEWLGESVRLTREVPPGPRLHRLWPTEPGLIPDWATAASSGTEQLSGIAGAQPGGRFTDFGAVHLVTTGALAALGRTDSDIRRLRPNLVLSLDTEPAPGDRIRIGPRTELHVLVPTPRCAMPAAAQPGLAADPGLLRTIGQHRTEVPGLGRAACFGSYARVVTPGIVSVGDRATIAA